MLNLRRAYSGRRERAIWISPGLSVWSNSWLLSLLDLIVVENNTSIAQSYGPMRDEQDGDVQIITSARVSAIINYHLISNNPPPLLLVMPSWPAVPGDPESIDGQLMRSPE